MAKRARSQADMPRLEKILEPLSFSSLPPAWTDFDLTSYSPSIKLWDYQVRALEAGLKALYTYYQKYEDFTPHEEPGADNRRRSQMFQQYRDSGLSDTSVVDIRVDQQRRDVRHLLEDHYPIDTRTTGSFVSFEHFSNRVGFWMATGSGKSLILIKMIEILWQLSQRGEIPQRDILILTFREDLISQLKVLVADFNRAGSNLVINLRDLKDYPQVKRSALSLFADHEITVFYYRSDNLSDQQKDKIIDFHNYDNGGKWYVLLDEAHKGDPEDAKRRHIYSILSRNGFLFNYSATFTDIRDTITTVFNFNLSRYINAGYGKHITVLRQESHAFKDDEDYTGIEKQKLVLKAMLMLAYAQSAREKAVSSAKRKDIYHSPLMMVLVNSVNVEDADLKLFFRELARIGKGDIDDRAWKEAKDELRGEIQSGLAWQYEGSIAFFDSETFENLTFKDLFRFVFHATGPGQMEVWMRPSNRQEMAFKLKSGDRPFALIKIGDVTDWMKGELEEYEIQEGFKDETYFERINSDDSDINILMGSRSFYEGWDSNRPNVILYINIGVGEDARKFILQSVGRAVRIEPIKHQRKRLMQLHRSGEIDSVLFQSLNGKVVPIESVVIIGTNRIALTKVMDELRVEGDIVYSAEIALNKNEDAIGGHVMLVPVFRDAGRQESVGMQPFNASDEDRHSLKAYVDYIGDIRVLSAIHDISPAVAIKLKSAASDDSLVFLPHGTRRFGNPQVLADCLTRYFTLTPKEVEGWKPLGEEIQHFEHIRVTYEDIEVLRKKIAKIVEYPREIKELRAKFDARQLSFDDFRAADEALKETDTWRDIELRWLEKHYYVPMLLATMGQLNYIQHVIREPSEIAFIRSLTDALKNPNQEFKNLDWWLFSKLDETLDSISIPYYDTGANGIREFHPDFIFWMQKGQDHHIVFLDPHGTEHSEWQDKVSGFHRLFEDESGMPRIWMHNQLTVRVHLMLFHQTTFPADPHWIHSPLEIAERVLHS